MRITSPDATPPAVDMTPMIDIVFQLIAFFMVITNFEQNEADERITLPKDQLARPPEVKRENAFVLNFGFDKDADGNIVDDTPYVFFGDERFTVDELRTRLEQEARFYEAINTDLADVTVEIRADAGVQAGMVQEMIRMCQEEGIGFQRFALKATQKSEF